jgi:two-component system copper resistance phosphate regulon response regulator CusR
MQPVSEPVLTALLVEDDARLAALTREYLEGHGVVVTIASDGRTGLAEAVAHRFDVVLLDLMLPEKSGLDVCRELRAAGKHVPVLMLTARDGVDARIDGLDSGADDYVIKPFDFRELLARMRALIRRRDLPLMPERFGVGPLTIDRRTRELFVDGTQVPLTAREFALIEHLATHHGHVISRKEIARHVWDDSYDPLSNVIDVYVQRLRRKIDVAGQPSFIRARRGEGYQLLCV